MNRHTESPDMISVPCPSCGAQAFRTLFQASDLLHGKPGTFGVVRCERCRTRFTNPRPVPEALKSFYPEEYAPYQTLVPAHVPLRSPLRRIIGNVFHAYMNARDVLDVVDHPGQRLLDIGCSTGTYLQSQRSCGAELYGVEFSERPATYAREILGLNVFCGNLEDARFDDATFDAVVAWMVMEHMPSPRQTIGEIHRILRPGGVFAFSVPNAGSWEFHVFRSKWFALQVPTHLTHFDVPTIRRLLDVEGFVIERVYYQRNIDSVVASLGYVLNSAPAMGILARFFIGFPNNSRVFARFIVRPLLQPIAWLLAKLRQGGRITIRARRLT